MGINHLKRPQPLPMKVSVNIPCVAKHFEYIPLLLESCGSQTVIPDEIVISLSEVDKVSPLLLAEVESKEWPFELKIIKHQEKRSEGANRNIACAHSLGDLIICQDADDIPHPQRVEIVKWLFENYEIDHLMHLFTTQENSFAFLENDLSKVQLCTTYREMRRVRGTTNGNVCFAKKIFGTVKWGESFKGGEDVRFNCQVYQRFSNHVVLHEPLLLYRIDLSAYAQ
jgi:cellulose synthase/poly-beta-1,6-N-acetylglucosamine synthase-like glycosyltransferase